jgi:hypothetical protein
MLGAITGKRVLELLMNPAIIEYGRLLFIITRSRAIYLVRLEVYNAIGGIRIFS